MGYLSKCTGCLLGGAVGDALGYPIEFMDEDKLYRTYGEGGISEYEYDGSIAHISDDTQMTLFTAVSLLVASNGDISKYVDCVRAGYIDWYHTQVKNYPYLGECACGLLMRDHRLFVKRAPGQTCLSALEKGGVGSIEEPINDSKGCGGLMRVAPIGLHFPYDKYPIEEIDMFGAEAAALTHGHELGYIPAAMLVHMVYLAVNRPDLSLYSIVVDAREMAKRLFSNSEHLPRLVTLIDRALELAYCDVPDIDCINRLGEGWVAEETLAIAVFCALRYADNFEKAIRASVNHGGDSDSTGSVCGNILGAYLGAEAIPDKFLKGLELKDLVYDVGRLLADCVEE